VTDASDGRGSASRLGRLHWSDEDRKLAVLILDLVKAAASRTDIIHHLTVNRDSVYVIKGWPETDPEGFDISTSYKTRGGRSPLARRKRRGPKDLVEVGRHLLRMLRAHGR
jgi:hypothetical protein